jgi:HEAT repeat protein
MDNTRFPQRIEYACFMAKRQFSLKIAAAVFAVCVAVWMVRHFYEPSYQGKSLSAWLDQAARDREIGQFGMETSGRDSQPAQAVLAMGPRAIPLLLDWLRAKDTPFRRKLRDFAQKYKWIPIDRRNPDDLNAMACYGFWVLGPAAKSAVPQVIALLDDEEAQVRASAASVLSWIGPGDITALPALEKRLNALCRANSWSNDWLMEASAVLHAVGEMGPAAKSALPQITLLSTLFSQRPELDAIASAIAARIKITGEGFNSAMEPLKNPSVSRECRLACAVAGELGTNGAPAVPLLLANLQCTNPSVQIWAIGALTAIHAQPDLCLPAIDPFLSSSNGIVRMAAFTAITASGRTATQWVSISQITPFLTDSDPMMPIIARKALRRLYPEAAAKLGVK